MAKRGLPCNNCISLPICKVMFIEAKNSVANENAIGLITAFSLNRVKDRCSLIRLYISRSESTTSLAKKKSKFYNYFSNVCRRK